MRIPKLRRIIPDFDMVSIALVLGFLGGIAFAEIIDRMIPH